MYKSSDMLYNDGCVGPVDRMHPYITGVVYTYSKSNTPRSIVRARSSIIGGGAKKQQGSCFTSTKGGGQNGF